jgi:Carboxypeptidase regulatory-like domain
MLYRGKSSTYSILEIIRQVFLGLSAGLLFVSVALAQSSVGGRVSGRVTDQSGAIIPGAHISAQNVSTGVVSGTQSDDSGYYVLQLPEGNYTISASATGMATLKHQNVVITIGGDAAVNFLLPVASAQTVVEVHGEDSAELITPNTSAVQTTVNNALVSTMPVEVSGTLRNADEFLRLEPGYNGVSLNGGSAGDAPTTVDGGDVSGSGFGAGQQTVGWAMPVPSFAVQEFQVVGSNADADVGRTPTGAISYALKSGTNQLHGSVFEYNRNTVYDAKTFFEPTRGVDQQNEFGFDLGGPIKHNKAFFYGYYDGFRYKTSNTGTFYSLLTGPMKTGDFSAAGIPAIYDPTTTTSNGLGGFTRQQFSCNGKLNVICPGEISPVSTFFASLFPDPTLPGLTNNYIGTSSTSNSFDQFLGKVDYTISSTSRFSFSYNWQRNPETGFGGGDPACPFGLACGALLVNFHGTRAIANWYKTFSSDKSNHVIVSFNLLDFFMHFGGQQSVTVGDNYNAMAGLGYVDGSGFAHLSAGADYLGGGSNINKIAHSVAKLADDFTWEHGSHQLQFGATFQYYATIGVQASGNSSYWGTFSFSPLETGLPGNSATGYAPASFLVGAVDSGGLGQNPNQAGIMPYLGIYGQDKWKIRPNLTLTYGLHYDYDPPITERQNKITSFDPILPNPGAGGIFGALIYGGIGPGRSGERQFADPWRLGFGPRVGLDYSLKPTTVFRAAYGLMYSDSSAPAEVMNQQGFYAQSIIQSTNGGVTPAFNWNSGFPPIPLGPDLVPTFANGGSTEWMPRNGARLPAVENYNIGVQQRLWGGIVVDASYVGTQSHYMYNGNLNPNQLDPSYLSLGNTLESEIGSAQAIGAGIIAPYTGFTGTVAQALRPYPQYQTITYLNDPVGNANYNALQVRAQKTLSHGLSMLIAYTREKNVTDVNSVGAQNFYNLEAEKAVASYDIPENFVAGYVYNLPIGTNQLLNFNNSLANKLLGGWTTSGIVTLQSGEPITVTTEQSLPSIGALLPNVVPGQPLYSATHTRGSFNPNNPSANKYININAFADPPAFTFGNAPRYFDSLRSFGLEDWDAALMKKFPIYERMTFTLKGEFFNVLNIVNFGPPAANIDLSTFGTITTINGNPRNGQVSGTFSW